MINKKKKSTYTLPFILLVVILLGALLTYKLNVFIPKKTTTNSATTTFNFSNQKITLDGNTLNFINGSYTNNDQETPHTARLTNQTINPLATRAAEVLVDTPGGSGIFYYIIGGMVKDGKESYSKPVLLGDRIIITSVKVDNPGATDNGVITVQYLDRATNAPMSATPTKKVTAKFAFQRDGSLIPVLH